MPFIREILNFMENHTPALPEVMSPTSETGRARWDRSAFRLHALAMNPDLAVMGSVPALEPAEGDLPVHWVLLDPVLASIVRSSVSHQKEIARLKGSAAASEGQLVADILLRLGLESVEEPHRPLACARFGARLLWRSAALTLTQHWDMEKAAQSQRPGRSRA